MTRPCTTLLEQDTNLLIASRSVKKFLKIMIKECIEELLKGELQEHLGYEKHAYTGRNSGNNRNGFFLKRVQTSHGKVTIKVPRDRNGTFKPQLIRSFTKTISERDLPLIRLFEEGLQRKDIALLINELYKHSPFKPNAAFISHLHTFIAQWHQNSCDVMYLSVSFDEVTYPLLKNGTGMLKKGYVCSGTDTNGTLNFLGLCSLETEEESFWKARFTALKNKGVTDIFAVYHNESLFFNKLIQRIFPRSAFQQYVLDLIHSSLQKLPKDQHTTFLITIKTLYYALTTAEVRSALKLISKSLGSRFSLDTSL
ncbi:transposase, partial [Candidatus Dependentiae bacterium]|nr:transposase [Candidatus Dependentiae bacterium]